MHSGIAEAKPIKLVPARCCGKEKEETGDSPSLMQGNHKRQSNSFLRLKKRCPKVGTPGYLHYMIACQ